MPQRRKQDARRPMAPAPPPAPAPTLAASLSAVPDDDGAIEKAAPAPQLPVDTEEEEEEEKEVVVESKQVEEEAVAIEPEALEAEAVGVVDTPPLVLEARTHRAVYAADRQQEIWLALSVKVGPVRLRRIESAYILDPHLAYISSRVHNHPSLQAIEAEVAAALGRDAGDRPGLDLVVLLDTSQTMAAGGWLAACLASLQYVVG